MIFCDFRDFQHWLISVIFRDFPATEILESLKSTSNLYRLLAVSILPFYDCGFLCAPKGVFRIGANIEFHMESMVPRINGLNFRHPLPLPALQSVKHNMRE